MKGWILGGLVVLGLGVSARAEAKPHHQGFTGDLGIGISLMLVPHHTLSECFSTTPGGCAGVPTGEQTEHTSELGLAPLSLTLAGWASPYVALGARLSGTSYFKSNGDQIAHGFYGPIVEVWPSSLVYLSGGIGLALYGGNA